MTIITEKVSIVLSCKALLTFMANLWISKSAGPGRAHDARIFKNSSLYRRMTTAPGLYPDLPFFPLNGIKIRPYF